MKVQLSLRINNLKRKADAYVEVRVVPNDHRDKLVILGKTEVIKNTNNPDWIKTFTLDYELGTPLRFDVSVFDEKRKGKSQRMGTAAFETTEILGTKGNTKAKSLPNNGGVLYARVDKFVSTGTFRFKLGGTNLKNVAGMFSKSDPFYEIARKDQGEKGMEWNTVYSSNVMNNLNPIWNEDKIELFDLCLGELTTPLRISVFDYEKSGKHVPMGTTETTVNGLVAAQNKDGLILKERGKNVGNIIVHKAIVSGLQPSSTDKELSPAAIAPVIVQPSATPIVVDSVRPTLIEEPLPLRPLPVPSAPESPTFIDYIKGGCEISFMVAIDFTGSNGDPRIPGTLHYHANGTESDYEKAILAVGNILSNFDADKKFPVWGFGAKYGGVVRHCFQCGSKEEVDGVEGILHAYREAFKSGLVMSGPTDFSEVIMTAGALASRCQDAGLRSGKQTYNILLILTDGVVDDIQKTASALDSVCECPLSVIIVGVGNANFDGMRFLDDRQAKIDVCDFVQFNEHKYNHDSLTKATLEEIPSHLENYFIRHGIQPLPPVNVTDEEIVIEPSDEEIVIEPSDEEIVIEPSDEDTVGESVEEEPVKSIEPLFFLYR